MLKIRGQIIHQLISPCLSALSTTTLLLYIILFISLRIVDKKERSFLHNFIYLFSNQNKVAPAAGEDKRKGNYASNGHIALNTLK